MEKTSLQLKDFDDFVNACKHFGIEINNNQLGLFKKHYEILIEWNKKINLISRKEENILEKHFLDSILFLSEINGLCRGAINRAPTILDIGSGGGFPGIPLAIMLPEWKFVLCESTGKKANFLNFLVKELGLKNVEIINARVETLHATSLPTKYDFVTARAVAKLDELIKYAKPLLKDRGCLLAYKGPNIDEEIANVKMQMQIFSKNLNEAKRNLIVIS